VRFNEMPPPYALHHTYFFVTMALRCASWATLLLILAFLQAYSGLSDEIEKQEKVIQVEKHTEKTQTTTCKVNDPQCNDNILEKCGIWLAESTIPNSGLGMYAGKEFHHNDELLETGDIVIPIVDFEMNQWRYRYKFLWDEYTWSSDTTLTEDEGYLDVNSASPGFGSCANSYLDLKNVEEWRPSRDTAGLDRARDAGAGAFSAYYNRRSTAKGNIKPGQELFVSYGQRWFEHRSHLGPIPLAGDHRRGQVLLEKFRRMMKRINVTHVLKDMWRHFIWESPFLNESRLLNTLPASWEDLEYAMNNRLLDMRKEKHRVTQEWLQEHGICMDNMRVAPSTIPQAGRGAFATRFLPKGTTVAPVPLLHVPHKDRFNMYNITPRVEANGKRTFVILNRRNATQLQLMTNYCYGHAKSTLLLCPYGVMTAAINHNQTRANLKMKWGKTGHHPEWLNMTIISLIQQKHAGLVIELVATRDIEPGEELFLDYGDEWENAWNEHVKKWQPPNGSYATGPTAEALNDDFDTDLRTVFEQMEDPYPEGVKIKCEPCFRFKGKWKKHLGNHTALIEYLAREDATQQDCDILQREQDENGTVLYTAVLIAKNKGKKIADSKLEKVPREAFVFAFKPYASDMHLPNAFRHAIMIPDEIFPEKWKNEGGGKETEEAGTEA